MNSTEETYRDITQTLNPSKVFDYGYKIESVIRLSQMLKNLIKSKLSESSISNIENIKIDESVKSFAQAQEKLQSKTQTLQQSISKISNRGELADSGMKIYICDFNNPENYMIVSAKKKINPKNNKEFIETEFRVFKNDIEQTCSEFSHGKFLHNSHRDGQNTSDVGALHWENMQKEIMLKSGIGEKTLTFKSEEEFNKYRALYDVRDKVLSEDEIAQIHNIENVKPNFTGQHTDIANIIAYKNSMPISVIDEIDNKDIQNAIKENFIKAEEKGLIEIDSANGVITLTQKGNEYVNKAEFVEQYKRHQLNSTVNQITSKDTRAMYVELNATTSDLQIFKLNNSFNLSSLGDDTESQKVVNNFYNLEKQGLVTIEDNVVKPTSKGKDLLNSTDFTLKAKVIDNDNIEEVGKNIVNQASSSSAQVTQDITKNVAQDVVKETAQQTVKEASKETAKAVGTAVTKAGSTASASTGVGVVITVGVEVAEKVAKVGQGVVQVMRTY